MIKIPEEFSVRLEEFIRLGIPRKPLYSIITEAFRRGNPGEKAWSQYLLTVADGFAKTADNTEDAWMQVSFWYFLGRFPYYFEDEMKEAYRKHKEVYYKASAFSQFPIEKINIHFEGQTIETYLRKPLLKTASLPLVIVCGGIDIWKSDLQIHQIGNAFLKQGIAVLALDAPGTGDCPIPISTTAERWFEAVLYTIKGLSNINSQKIGFYGLSFGGYWASKLAIQWPFLVGTVNVGGPIHDTFDANWLDQLPAFTHKVLARSCGFEEKNPAFLSYFSELSLLHQGYLPAKSHAPLLYINGAKDSLVKISEIESLENFGIEADKLVFSKDRHVASQHWHLHVPFSVHWLVEKLQ